MTNRFQSVAKSFVEMRVATIPILLLILRVHGAPRSNENVQPQTFYDQKQTGDYNIQVHLKDFQIIALLGDESLGEYDYEYDYSDFTIKPPNATSKPPPEEVSTTKTTTIQEPSSSPKPENVTSTTAKIVAEKTTVLEKLGNTTTTTNSPDKIKVQIIEDPVSIVPADDMGVAHDTPPLGEVLHYRKCATGYTRDKKGRCRRVRRPGGGLPQFDFGKLATNIAARFREDAEETSSTPVSST